MDSFYFINVKRVLSYDYYLFRKPFLSCLLIELVKTNTSEEKYTKSVFLILEKIHL